MPAPAFTDLSGCRNWLAQQSLADPDTLHARLREQLAALLPLPFSARERLAILELLREAIFFAQGELSKRLLDRPLPLAPAEQVVRDAVQALWLLLAEGYQHCLSPSSPPMLENERALAGQRLLASLADAHYDLVRSGAAVPPLFWRRLYSAYRDVEGQGLATLPVDDALRSKGRQTPREAFVETVLLAVASPQELFSRQQAWVARWARRWAGKIEIVASPPALAGRALPLCLDLASDEPPGYLPRQGDGARWLLTTALRASLKARLERLARGPELTPARLGLGEDCVEPACSELLRRLYPRWVKGGVHRRHERLPFAGPCVVSVGFAAIHYYLAGRRVAFADKGNEDRLLREREELALFDRLARRFAEEYSRNHGFFLEDWQVAENWQSVDRSLGGVRLMRPLAQAGARIALTQLIAIRAPHEGFLLGSVRWLHTTADALIAGIERIPGKPQAVALRGTGVNAKDESYRAAFWLSAEDGERGYLLAAPATFRPNRILELWDGRQAPRHLRCKALLARGIDYEQIEADFIGP